MTPLGIQSALDFLTALPALEAAGRIDAATIPTRVDYPSLANAGAACGFRFEAEDIAEAFRIKLQTRLAAVLAARPT